MTVFILKAITKSINVLRAGCFRVGYKLADARWYFYDLALTAYTVKRKQQTNDAQANLSAALEHARFLKETARTCSQTKLSDIRAFRNSL